MSLPPQRARTRLLIISVDQPGTHTSGLHRGSRQPRRPLPLQCLDGSFRQVRISLRHMRESDDGPFMQAGSSDAIPWGLPSPSAAGTIVGLALTPPGVYYLLVALRMMCSIANCIQLYQMQADSRGFKRKRSVRRKGSLWDSEQFMRSAIATCTHLLMC